MKKLSHAVVDTNVLLIANQQHQGVSPECVFACVEWLELLRERGCTVLDHGYEVLGEYRNKTTPNTGNRVGDAFLKWLYQNMGNAQRVSFVSIEKHPERGYAGFPNDPALAEFDPADRKFVAVAAAHPNKPPILQGSDAKWLEWSGILDLHGIQVSFLCPADVRRSMKRKRSG